MYSQDMTVRMPLLIIWLTWTVGSVSARESTTAVVESVEIGVNAQIAPENVRGRVYYRVPTGYDPASRISSRVLVFFDGRNCAGEREASGILGFAAWADAHNIFIVAPGFKDDDYWQPKRWSGQALRDALALIRRKYRIDDRNLLFYGYSAGSQASNLFPAWQPERTRAWVSHAGGVFFRPDAKMKGIAGLVTCGDADFARYVISRRFVEQCRELGINILWKSYPNLNHAVPPESTKFAQDFLAYYHELYINDLKPNISAKPVKEPVEYVGDDQDGTFWPAKHKMARAIPKEDCVYFPSLALAEAWGTPARIWLNAQAQIPAATGKP